jgi:putative sterol carrier protein
MLGLKEQLTKEIRKLEKSATSKKRLAIITALKDDKEAFYEHIKNAAKNGEMHREDFELAAIYKDFHRDVDFKTKLDEIFKHG